MAEGSSSGGAPTRGRGAAILAALSKLKKPGSDPQTSKEAEEPPKPRGRAALLQKLAQRKELKAGPSEEEQSVATEAVRKELETTSIAEPSYYRGTGGQEATVACNYIRLNLEPERGVYEYDLRFKPEVDDKRARFKLLHMAIPKMGGIRMYDGGSQLYLPIILPQITTTFALTHPYTEKDVDMIVTFKVKKRLGECLHLFNVLFKRVMQTLMYSRVGRSYYNPDRPYLIPQHKLEVLPGYAIAVDEYEDGVMLCLDTQHRVMRSETVLEVLKGIHQRKPEQLTKEAFVSLVGTSVLTKYNNRTYEIDDIIWDANPEHTFETSQQKKISYVEYYKSQYDIDIKDRKQPLLLNRQKRKIPGQAEPQELFLFLIPELCYVTGLSDSMRSDFRVMKDVAMYTRVTPNQRILALRKYLENVQQTPEAKKILADWGLSLENATVDIMARVLDAETVVFGGGVKALAEKGEFNNAVIKNPVLIPADLKRWAILYTKRDERVTFEFRDNIGRVARSTGMVVNSPNCVLVSSDRTEYYINAVREITAQGPQMLVFIVPTPRDDRYAAIKKICCTEHVVPSQVINAKTLSNPQKVRTITQKILLQMNCKLGGALWTLRFPFKKWMICGMDVYHSKTTNQSVCGFVASINETISRWFSMAIFQKREISNQMKLTFAKSLEKWSEVNGCYPTNIIIYRDGVGDGQLQYVIDHEMKQFEECLRDYNLTDMKITMIVVQKRISTRMYRVTAPDHAENAPPGTIVDSTITRRNWLDFFLVAQNVRQGTVTPTHYVVVKDSANMPPDHVQKLSYKLCHMYYNWTGTVRVPAPCQYAHKLAYLVGQHIKAAPSTELSDLLYYL